MRETVFERGIGDPGKCKNVTILLTTGSHCEQLGYLSTDIICSSKRTVQPRA